MLNINFIPEDYIRNNESSRTNLFYLVLLGLVMAGLISVFAVIKIRQHTLAVQEKNIDMEMEHKKEMLKQFEELQAKSSMMWKTALTTAELLEPAPRSVILASLTNNLPAGTSLLKLSIIQRQVKNTGNPSPPVTSKFDQLTAKNKQQESINNVSPEQLLETYIEIDGIAPSDI
jgi:Tfp pilus assembly protein PilN